MKEKDQTLQTSNKKLLSLSIPFSEKDPITNTIRGNQDMIQKISQISNREPILLRSKNVAATHRIKNPDKEPVSISKKEPNHNLLSNKSDKEPISKEQKKSTSTSQRGRIRISNTRYNDQEWHK